MLVFQFLQAELSTLSNQSPVPPPRQLTLERQLNKSIMIGWNHPDTNPGIVDCYHVYVDGNLRTTVKVTERPRALVEGVDSNRVSPNSVMEYFSHLPFQPHRISVHSVTADRRRSRDAACTMIIGKGAPFQPACLRSSNVTSTSACISWLPSNSNFQHVISVNNVELTTLKPGVYRHTITGLTPNTMYKVSVMAKNIRAPNMQHIEKNPKMRERLSAHTEFRTLPKGMKLS